MAASWTGYTGIRALHASIPTLSCDTFKASVSGIITVLSGTTAQYTNLNGTAATLSHPSMGSVSIIETINLKQTYVDLATGDAQYTVAGLAAGDILLDGNYVRFSAGAVQTAGALTLKVHSDTLVSVTGCVSTALGCINWIDISA